MSDPRQAIAKAIREALNIVVTERRPKYLSDTVGTLVDADDERGFLALADAALAALAAPPPEAGLRRDPGVDWDAIERLVDAAIRREEITAARGAEILGLRLVTWRARALEIRAAAKENDHE